MNYKIRKNLLLMHVFVLVNVSSAYAWEKQHTAYLLGGLATVAATVWAGFEHTQKNTMNEKFTHSEDRANNLQKKLREYEQGLIQQARSEEFLGCVELAINEVETRYKDIMHHDVDKQPLVHVLEQVLTVVRNHNNSYMQTTENLKKRIDGLLALVNRLELQQSEWIAHNKNNFVERSKTYIKKITPLLQNAYALQSFLEKHQPYIPLVITYTQLENTYNKEIVLARACTNGATFMENLDAHIRSMYIQSNSYFPYLTYVERITQDNNALVTLLNALHGYTMEPFQQEYVAHAYQMKEFLEDIIQRIVMSPLYTQEKVSKPEFDRADQRLQAELYEKQERLKAELREKQARIEHEKDMAKLALKKERTRRQELETQHEYAQRERKAFEAKEKELDVELARIKDQENVKRAVAQINKEWQLRIVNLNDKIEEYEKTATQMVRDLDRVQNCYQVEIKRYNEKLKELAQQVYLLKDQLPRVPCNVESVDGLQNYLDGLLARVMGIEELINS